MTGPRVVFGDRRQRVARPGRRRRDLVTVQVLRAGPGEGGVELASLVTQQLGLQRLGLQGVVEPAASVVGHLEDTRVHGLAQQHGRGFGRRPRERRGPPQRGSGGDLTPDGHSKDAPAGRGRQPVPGPEDGAAQVVGEVVAEEVSRVGREVLDEEPAEVGVATRPRVDVGDERLVRCRPQSSNQRARACPRGRRSRVPAR